MVREHQGNNPVVQVKIKNSHMFKIFVTAQEAASSQVTAEDQRPVPT